MPLRAGPVDVPAAVHPEVRAQRAAVGEPDEQVLAAGDDLADRGAGQVEGGQLRDAELAPAQRRRRPARCSSAGRPARRCLPRARAQCPRPGITRARCESPDSRDDGGAAGRCEPSRERSPATARPVRRRCAGPAAEPVTVTVARVVRPDQRRGLRALGRGRPRRWPRASPGNLGATLLHPGPDSSEYHLVYRFAGRRLAGRLGAVVRAAVGAGARRGDGRRRALRPGRRAWRASSPGRRSRDRAGG